jgi:uncharacterized membrane protein
MNDLASWRTEVWHPLLVHFPIVLLLFATIFKVASLLMKPPTALFWQWAASLLLYFGVLFAWASIYTGDLADGIVSRKLCDPTVLKDHENAAYNLGYLFLAAALLDISLKIQRIKLYQKALHLLIALLMLIGTYFLVLAGHSGAKVVYEQAGGVSVPSANCSGF